MSIMAKLSEDLKKWRFERLRAAMDEENYETLIVAGRFDAFQLGYLRYISNWRLWAGNGYVIFSLKEEPELVLPAQSQTHWADQQCWISVIPASNPAEYISDYINNKRLDRERVGLVGSEEIMPVKDYRYIVEATDLKKPRSATDLFEKVRMVKHEEEIELMEEDAKTVESAFLEFKEYLAPGKTEAEVVADAHQDIHSSGGLTGIAHLSHETPPYIHPPSGRKFREDDVIKFSIEHTGPNGFWTELAGIFSFSEPPREVKQKYQTVLKAFKNASEMMAPGTDAHDIVEKIKETYVRDGWEIGGRGIWDIHGIGMDVIEEPRILDEDSFTLKNNMVLCLHPGLLIGDEKWGVYIQDSFLVTEEGGQQLSDLSHEWYMTG